MSDEQTQKTTPTPLDKMNQSLRMKVKEKGGKEPAVYPTEPVKDLNNTVEGNIDKKSE